MDRFSTEQFRTTSGFVARQVTEETENDNSAAPCTLSLLSIAGGRENAKRATIARDTSLIRDLEIRRHTLGWSIKELGDRCGIDESFLSEWECGAGSPRLDAIEDWASALGLTLAFIRADSEIRHGLQVDWDKHRITVDDTPIRLTPMEWKALERLAWTPGELVTHQALFRHLYGDDRHHRAQSTAIRVLITKLRRLLPIRIEARWGQGYVISEIEPSLAHAHRDDAHRDDARPDDAQRTDAHGIDEPDSDRGATPRPEVAEEPCSRTPVTPAMTLPSPPPIRRELASLGVPAIRRVAAAPARPNPGRAEELGVIERFLAERGVTRCPDLTTIQQSPLPTLVWDKVKRKWVRPSATGCEMGCGSPAQADQAAGRRPSSTA